MEKKIIEREPIIVDDIVELAEKEIEPYDNWDSEDQGAEE